MSNGNTSENYNGGNYTNKEYDGTIPADLTTVEYSRAVPSSNVNNISYTLNQISGITGYTCKGSGPEPNDHGEVQCVNFTIPFENRLNNVIIEFPDPLVDPDVIDEADGLPMSLFGAMMGDGTIIDISKPIITNVSDSSAVVEFTMDRIYAMNSPCELIYRTNKAWIKITEVS